MDSDEKESNEKPTSEASKGGNAHNRSDDDDDEKIAEKDLEYLSNKTKKQWRDYERSLERPTHDSMTEDPLHKSMEDLRLRNKNSPGASTSSSLNVSRTSQPKTKKKGKRSITKKKGDHGTQKGYLMGLRRYHSRSRLKTC